MFQSNYKSFKPENLKKALKFLQTQFNKLADTNPTDAQELAVNITDLKNRITSLEKQKSKTVTQQAPAKTAPPVTPPPAKSTYKDGTYSADGSYRSPAGTETIGVTITLKGDVITKVTVVPKATDPKSDRFQDMFASGISEVVVGKKIDTLQVSKISGSSLTSGGFNEAVTKIEAAAKNS
jgi:uncharacterized protein with FMN-binding domain